MQELVDIGETVRITQKSGMLTRGVDSVSVYVADVVRANGVGVRIKRANAIEVIPWSSIIELEIVQTDR